MLLQAAFIDQEIQSITEEDDSAILQSLIAMHAPVKDPYIVDCTYCEGVMWKGCSYQPDWKIDNRDLPGLDAIDDFTNLDSVNHADVLVFDPPHLPTAAGSENSSKIWEHRYGLTGDDEDRHGYNISGTFRPFLQASKRVLAKHGVILAKIADLTHSHRYQWQHIMFIKACEDEGLTPCDMVIKWGVGGNLKSSRWENSFHVRKTHSFWIVVRNSKRCERPYYHLQEVN